MALRQAKSAFGTETGTEATHGTLPNNPSSYSGNIAAGDVNQNISRERSAATFLARFLIQSDASTAGTNTAVQLQYSKNSGAFTNVTTTSSNIKAVTTSVFADAASTTARLQGTGTFESSSQGCSHDGLSGGAQQDIVANGNAENLFSVQLVPADLVVGDTIDLRMSTSPTAITVYDFTPRITVTANIQSGVGTAAGVGTATAPGVEILKGAGTAAGVGTATGVGSRVLGGVGTAAGVGTASGVSPSGGTISSGAGTAAGAGTALAAGAVRMPYLPDTALAASNLRDTLTNVPPTRLADIDDNPDSPDSEWWTAVNPAAAITQARIGFQTPDGNLVATQTFELWLRKTAGADNPTIAVDLYENGTLVQNLISGVAITSTTGQRVTAPWDGSLVTNRANAEILVKTEPRTLTASGPVTATSNGQIIEGLDITATGTSNGITVNAKSNVTIRYCRIRYATGKGIFGDDSPGLEIHDVDIATTSAPSIGANASAEMNCIDCFNCDNMRISRARLTNGSSGAYIVESDRPYLRYFEGYNFRGPEPRGQLVQFDKCLEPVLEDFSVINEGHIAWTEDCINLYGCTRPIVRRGFISGCNSASGIGVLFENFEGGTGGLCEDVDCVYWANGAFSAADDTNGVHFWRCRARDGMDTTPNDSEGELDYEGNAIPHLVTWLGTQTGVSRQPPLSGSEAFFAYNTAAPNIEFHLCEYFNLPHTGAILYDFALTTFAQFSQVDFTPRAPIVLTFSWED